MGVIVSASYKTDIPALYGRWLMRRLEAGYCLVVNPWNGRKFRVDLGPGSVDAFVFWTRNLGPFFDKLPEIEAVYPFMVQQGITNYPRALDKATPDYRAAVAQLRRLADRFGPRVGVWRYDPVVFTSLTPAEWHLANFARLATLLEGVVDEAVVSVAQIYRKTANGLRAAANEHGFTWNDPEPGEKRRLLSQLARLAAARGMRLSVCCQPELLVEGANPAACIDLARLSDIAGRSLSAPRRPHRTGCGCGCWSSRDIGAYDSCTQGCAYCYAVTSRDNAKRHLAAHDWQSESL